MVAVSLCYVQIVKEDGNHLFKNNKNKITGKYVTGVVGNS